MDLKRDKEELTQLNQMLVQEVDVMKHQMAQMTSYVQNMEQRNMELAAQMQGLIAAIKGGNVIEMPNKDSPQMIHRPKRLDPSDGDMDGKKERSSSPSDQRRQRT